MRQKIQTERLQLTLSPDLVEAIDTYRFSRRIESRNAAIRELIERGLTNGDSGKGN